MSGTRILIGRTPRTAGGSSGSAIWLSDIGRKLAEDAVGSDTFVFSAEAGAWTALWDSGVRDALYQAAEAEGCDFPGLGSHSFRRANITWRQQVGGSAIEASKIAGHVEMTGEYTFVTPACQNELTRRIQEKLASASNKSQGV